MTKKVPEKKLFSIQGILTYLQKSLVYEFTIVTLCGPIASYFFGNLIAEVVQRLLVLFQA